MASLAAAADEPLSTETVEHFLRDLGLDVFQDLGGLRAAEIVELLSPIGFCHFMQLKTFALEENLASAILVSWSLPNSSRRNNKSFRRPLQ